MYMNIRVFLLDYRRLSFQNSGSDGSGGWIGGPLREMDRVSACQSFRGDRSRSLKLELSFCLRAFSWWRRKSCTIVRAIAFSLERIYCC